MKEVRKEIASALLAMGAIGFSVDTPVTFKSGIVSPVYADNRKWPYYPQWWQMVIEGFKRLANEDGLKFEVIAGIETAGIPHSAVLGYTLEKPSVFVRKKVKDHGTKKRVEGGEVAGKRVLLLEDLVTTGSSSLEGVQALRDEGARVTDCIAIVKYGFAEAEKNFEEAEVTLRTLTTFMDIFREAREQGLISEREMEEVTRWLEDPWGWGESR